MDQVTVITDVGRILPGTTEAGRVLIAPSDLEAALGWELTAEGLCRGDVCVIVRDPAALRVGERVDVAAAAGVLGRLVVVDADAGVVAVSAAPEVRRAGLVDREAPPFSLADLDGEPHDLTEWRGTKKLVVAFATW